MFPDANCAVHPTAPAESTCARCGAFACWPCLHLHEDGFVCASCYDRVQSQPLQHSRLGLISIAIGGTGLLASLAAGWFASPVCAGAILAGAVELARIRSGAAAEHARSPAIAGVGLGVAGVVVGVLVGLAFWR